MSDDNETNGSGDAPQQESPDETKLTNTTTTTTTTSSNDENDQTQTVIDDAKIAKRRKKLQKLVRVLLILPYIVGILWTCLHPIVSVITGELKCRGWYLDEHSIETRFTAGQKPQLVPTHLKALRSLPVRSHSKDKSYSLCDFFAQEDDPSFNDSNLLCHRHGDHFEVAMIMPLSNAIDASEEAVVLVVPKPSDVYESLGAKGMNPDWNSSIFHKAMVQSIQHLANPVETPWLAKAVLVVTPTMNSDESLEQTVSSFLNAYSGQQTISHDYQRNRQDVSVERIPSLPLKLSGAIIRNLVVLEVKDKSSTKNSSARKTTGTTDLSILPQGRRGVLPNADLVFLVGKLMEQTIFYNHVNAKSFLAHPYTSESKSIESWAKAWIDRSGVFGGNKENAKRWAKGMIDVILFAKTLAVGPFPPHAPALERGIDSLTIRASFDGSYYRDPSVELVQYSEYIIRSLANLHERLHHSFTLYLLPSPKTFVSHIEYLVPNILLLLPLAVRVFGVLLPKMKRGMDLKALGGILLIVLVMDATLFLVGDVFGFNDSPKTMAILSMILCVGMTFLWVKEILHRNHHRKSIDVAESSCDNPDSNPETTRTILTLQLTSCALAVYILMPIAFSHASLSYLPSVLLTPLLAFPDYPSLKKSNLNSSGKVMKKLGLLPTLCILAVATAPSILLVPRMFSTFTPFVLYAYTPIHTLFVLLVTSMLLS